MNAELRRLIGLGLAVAALLTVVFLVLPRVLGAAAGSEVEVLTELKAAESRGVELDVGLPDKLISTKASFDRVSVSVTGGSATANATLDFEGRVKDTVVSSLGAERVPFHLVGYTWEPTQGWAPQLTGVVRALERRRRALERGEVSGLCSGAEDAGESAELAALFAIGQRKLKARAWFIRSEREGVIVTEEWALTGATRDRPIDERGSRRLLLQAAAGGEFCFPAGLM